MSGPVFPSLRFGWWVLVLSLALSAGAGEARAGGIYHLELRETIQPITADYVSRGISEAEKGAGSLVILEIDTPGGLVDSTRAITARILDSKVPVAVFVSPKGARAASAGFVILLSADIAAMCPATNTGAAHPVGIGGEGSRPDKDDKSDASILFEKVENDMAAMVRTLATTRGRNVESAELGVRKSLSFTEGEALDKKLIDLVAANPADLVRQLDGRKIKRSDGREVTLSLAHDPIVPVPMTRTEVALAKALHPQIVALLMLAGIVGLGFELTHPGAILPGVVGAISLLLALYALAILPVNFVGVGLLVLAVAFFIAEFKVTSHGILGFAGALALVLGAALLIDAPIPEMRIHWTVFLPTAIILAGSFGFMASRAAAIRMRKATTGVEGLVGAHGVALTALDPSGKVFVEGAYWDAFTASPVAKGQRIEVDEVRGMKLRVHAAASEPNDPAPGSEPAAGLAGRA